MAVDSRETTSKLIKGNLATTVAEQSLNRGLFCWMVFKDKQQLETAYLEDLPVLSNNDLPGVGNELLRFLGVPFLIPCLSHQQ